MKVLVFGGTTEGRRLSAAMSRAGIEVTLSVATDFGRHAAENDGVRIISDRLGRDDISGLLKQSPVDCVIDATHPYAVLATQEIRAACEAVGQRYLRLVRADAEPIPGITYVENADAAASILKENNEKVLLTIGSKELEPFTRLPGYESRIFVRILPMRESLEKANALGFRGSNIICMQGPFDRQMNTATLEMTGAKYLVTKDSGEAGGFEAKVAAAAELGCEVIVIARPVREEGFTYAEILDIFDIDAAKARPPFFPLFVDLQKRKVLVLGGGSVAERRIRTLMAFGADITVISPTVTEAIESMAAGGLLRLVRREYKTGDIDDIAPFLVIAATNNRQANQGAMREADWLNIHISVADCREECSCYFPAIARSADYVAGLVSKNGDHKGVRRMAEEIRGLLNR